MHGVPLYLAIVLATFIATANIHAQSRYEGPIIDMHMHAFAYYLELGPDGKPKPFDCYPAPCEGLVTKALNERDVLRMTLSAMDEHDVVLGF